MSGLLFIPGLEQADLADEATVQAALASALWFPGSPTSICGIEEPGLLFALSASTALNPYPLALFSDDQDGALWRGTLAASVFSDTGGATLATLGGTVARANDTSGNGINLSQASSSLRPKFGSRPVTGIRNLLDQSHFAAATGWTQLSDTFATGVNQRTRTAGFADPDGGTGAVHIAESNTDNDQRIYQSGVVRVGTTLTLTAIVKAGGRSRVVLRTTANTGAVFNLSTGVATAVGGTLSQGMTDLGGGWWRCTVSMTDATTVAWLMFDNGTYGNYLGDGTSGVYVYGYQAEEGATSTAVQNRVSAQDVTEAGVESVSYLLFDLYDDALPSVAFPDGLTGQAFVAGDGGCYVTDLTIAPAATFSIGGTSHNWTGATPGILRAVTGNTGRVLDMAVREGDFTETELDRLVRKYRALGGKGLLVPTGELLTLASMTGGTGWAYASSIWTKTAGVASLLSQAVVPIAAGYYQFEIAATRSAGTLTPRFTGTTTVSGAAISATGTHTGVLVAASGNNAFELSADSAFDGTVTAVSLQRLLPEEEL